MIEFREGEWSNGGWIMFLLINSTADIAFYTISVLSANSPCPKSKYLTNCHVTHVLLSHKEARKLPGQQQNYKRDQPHL